MAKRAKHIAIAALVVCVVAFEAWMLGGFIQATIRTHCVAERSAP